MPSDNPDVPQRKPLSTEEKQALAVQRKADAKAATRDYHAAARATRDRTARLRAERLERESAVSAGPPQSSHRPSKLP